MKRVFLLAAGMALLFAAGTVWATPATPDTDDGTFEIGIVVKSFTNPYWSMLKKAAEEKAAELGVKVTVLGTMVEGDYAAQVAHMEDLVTKGVDLIGLVPAEASALIPAVEAARAAGIETINLGSPIGSDVCLSFIGSDHIVGGNMAAQYVAEQLGGQGKVAILRGKLGNPVELLRYTGFTEKIAEFPGIEVVAEGAADWEADLGYNVMEDFLTAHPEIQAVFAESDRMILGAATAASAAGRDDIILIGYDGIAEAMRAVQSGTISADVAQRPDLMGSYMIEYGLKYLQTGQIDSVINTPMTVVTPENVDPIVADLEALGF